MNEKLNKGLAGEYAACSELLKRGYTARITEGNAKGVDIVLFDNVNKTYKTVEVKTSTKNNVVTGFFQKYYDKTKPHPDYWIIVNIDRYLINHYYILTHEEIGKLQMMRNKMTEYKKIEGCDNLLIKDLEPWKDNWMLLNY